MARGGATGGAALAALALASSAAAAPQRIVSLNPCLDVILVRVADRAQIAGLSRWSRDPQTSTVAALARTYPAVDVSAEAVVARRADLVLASSYAPQGLAGALARLRTPMESFAVPATVAESEAQVRRVAALAGHPERGEALVREIERALASAAPPPGAPVRTALLFEAGGFTTGPGTLMEDLMRRAGLANKAHAYGYGASREVELERVVADPPDVLLVGEGGRGSPSRAQRLMAHPALAALARRIARAEFPASLTYCGGPVIAPAVAALAEARARADGRP